MGFAFVIWISRRECNSGMLKKVMSNIFGCQSSLDCPTAHFDGMPFSLMSGRRVETIARFRADAVW